MSFNAVTAAELTFGIEIETLAPLSLCASGLLRIGGYGFGSQVSYLPAGWKACQDGSLNGMNGFTGCEIVSPVLKGDAGIRQVLEVCAKLESMGHKVNSSCGVHIHVGWRADFTKDALARLIQIASFSERGIYAITGTKARETGAYSRGIRQYANANRAENTLTRDRYHGLNLKNLQSGGKQTVEFRYFSGTTSGVKCASWIQICLGMCERALTTKNPPVWNPKNPKGPGQNGRNEAERLMTFIGWRNRPWFQGGKRFGWVSDAMDLKICKKEMRRLADKYDGTV